MSDTLLSEATIHLFGRNVEELKIESNLGGVGHMAKRLADAKSIARIYAFAFQNDYVELASPALFVLREAGMPVAQTVAMTGLAWPPHVLADDLLVWLVDRDDITVRLDVMAGTFDRVLLDYELADNGLADFAPRGGSQLGTPTAVRGRRRPRGWRSDDE